MQTVGTALNDAKQQKEKAKKTLVSLSADLEEQRSKVKIIEEMLVLSMFSVVNYLLHVLLHDF